MTSSRRLPGLPKLRLVGRDAPAFRRAVDAHATAWRAVGGGELATDWRSLPHLQASLLHGGDLAADLVLVPADWLPALATSEVVRPLADVDLTPWTESFAEGVTYEGEVWGLPFHDGPQLLFTRRDASPPPATWDELADLAAAWHSDRRAGTILAGAPDGHSNVYDYAAQVWRFGGDVLQPDSAAARAALDFLRRLVTTVVAPQAHAMDSNASGAEMAADRVTVCVNWAGYASATNAAGVPLTTAIAPGTTVNAFWALAITLASDHPGAAEAYVHHATSVAMDLCTTRAGASGARLSTWRDPGIVATHPEYALFESAHRASRQLPRVPQLPAVVDALNELVDAVVWRGEHREPAIQQAQAAIDNLTVPQQSAPKHREFA